MDKYYLTTNKYEGRFAEAEEIEAAYSTNCYAENMITGAGLHIITDGNQAVVDDSESSTGVIASTGAGKTRRVLMEYTYSCIRKGESIVCHDPKGEILKHMRNTLQDNGYKVLVLDYREPMRGDRYNNLEYPARLYKSGNRSRASEMFRSYIDAVISSVQDDTEPFWHNSAASLLHGYLLLMCELFEPEDVTIKNVYDLHIQGNGERGSLGGSALKRYFSTAKDSIACELIYPAISGPTSTQDSIFSVFSTCLTTFIQNENIIDMTSNSTFQVEDLLDKTALFIITRDEANVYNSLISATIDQLFTLLIDLAETKYNGKLPRRVEFIIDEFGSLTQIPNINMKLTSSRSRNIRWLLVYQSLQQLSLIYGEDIAPIIIGNCVNLVYMHSPDMELLKMISERCGTTLDEYTNERRPLISVERLQHFDKESGETLMLLNRMHPFVTHLPDILEYPVKPVENLGLPERKRQEFTPLNFKEKLLKTEKEVRDEKPDNKKGRRKSMLNDVIKDEE